MRSYAIRRQLGKWDLPGLLDGRDLGSHTASIVGELQKRTAIAYLVTSAMLYCGRHRPHRQTSFHIEERFP